MSTCDTKLKELIIDFIKRNRVSTTEVADALGKTGLLDARIKAINKQKFAVGPLFYAPSFNGSNWYSHKFIQNVKAGDVVYVEAVKCGNRAVFGELVSKYALLYRQAAAIVVSGYVRDVPNLLKESYPIWAYGGTPIGCVNSDRGLDKEYYEKRIRQLKDAILVADDSGCVIIRARQQTEDFYGKLKKIEDQEDGWFDSIDRRKLSTFETVCLKK